MTSQARRIGNSSSGSQSLLRLTIFQQGILGKILESSM